MVELVKFIISNLVENVEDLEVKEIEGDTTTILEISVAKEDMGHVIGKQGKVINAIREIVRASLKKGDKKVMIEVV